MVGSRGARAAPPDAAAAAFGRRPLVNGVGVVPAAPTFCVPLGRISPERRTVLLRDLQIAGDRLDADVDWLPAWNARGPKP